MVHSEKAIVCIGPHDFVLSLMRSMEQDPVPPHTPSLSITIGGKTKTKTIEGHKTGGGKTQNWETNNYTWTFILCFCTLRWLYCILW